LWYPSPFLFDPQSFELMNSLLPRVSTDNHQLSCTFKLNTPCVKLVQKVHTSFLASEGLSKDWWKSFFLRHIMSLFKLWSIHS
jgi:hypothetical protein